jgi:hypothetical protein
MAQKHVPVERFDTDWNMTADVDEKGGITAQRDAIHAAQSILIKNELRALHRTLREMNSSMNAIRHFFHALGQERLRLIVKEKHRELDLRAKRRRRRLAARRRELRAAR